MLIALCCALASCDSFCILGFCSTKGLTQVERQLLPAENRYTVAGYLKKEFHSHSFVVSEEVTLQQLSFGIDEARNFQQYSAVKRIHQLNDQALKRYREEYLIPRKECPASFMNQHLQSLVLLPSNDNIATQLDVYDIPFDPTGTEFKLKGYYLTHEHSYFIRKGQKYNLSIVQHENVMSNVGSAKHKAFYFLVTAILE